MMEAKVVYDKHSVDDIYGWRPAFIFTDGPKSGDTFYWCDIIYSECCFVKPGEAKEKAIQEARKRVSESTPRLYDWMALRKASSDDVSATKPSY